MSFKFFSPKARLIAMIAVESVLIFVAKIWEASVDNPSNEFLTWYLLVPLLFGVVVVWYAYTISLLCLG